MSAPAVHLQVQNDVLTRASGVLPLYAHEVVLHLGAQCTSAPATPAPLRARDIAELDTVLLLCTDGCDPTPLTATLPVPYVSALVDGLYLVLNLAQILQRLAEHAAQGPDAEPSLALLEELEELQNVPHDLSITPDPHELGIAEAVRVLLEQAHTYCLRPDLPNTHLLYLNGDRYRLPRDAEMQHALAHPLNGPNHRSWGLRARLTNAEVAALFPDGCGVTARALPAVLTPVQVEVLTNNLTSDSSMEDQLAVVYATTC